MSPLREWQQFEAAAPEEQTTFLQELARQPDSQHAEFEHVSDMLAYHDKTAVLADFLTTAVTQPSFQALTEWQQQALLARASDAIIINHIKQQPEERPSIDIPDPQLQQQLNQVMPTEPARLAAYVAALRGQLTHPWQLGHFHTDQPTPETNQQAGRNLAILMIEFLGYLHQQAEISLSQGNLVRPLIPVYLVERRTGQLEPRQDMAARLRGEHNRPLIRPQPHPLCPDAVTLEKYLTKLLNYDAQPYKATAFFILMPAWLRFLAHRQLIDASQQQETSDDLKTMIPHLADYLATVSGDPTLQRQVLNWDS